MLRSVSAVEVAAAAPVSTYTCTVCVVWSSGGFGWLLVLFSWWLLSWLYFFLFHYRCSSAFRLQTVAAMQYSLTAFIHAHVFVGWEKITQTTQTSFVLMVSQQSNKTKRSTREKWKLLRKLDCLHKGKGSFPCALVPRNFVSFQLNRWLSLSLLRSYNRCKIDMQKNVSRKQTI